MKMIEQAVKDSMDLWEGYLSHPFVKGAEEGTLTPKQFETYLVQDSIYLKEYARVFALAMYRAETLREMQLFYDVLSVVINDESSTRVRFLRQYGVDPDAVDRLPQLPENKAYTDFMLEMAGKGLREALMAVLPCMLSYCYIAREVVGRSPGALEKSPYGQWLADYASDRYRDKCAQWAAFTDRLCEGDSDARKEELSGIFRVSSQHEMRFWDMSYAAK